MVPIAHVTRDREGDIYLPSMIPFAAPVDPHRSGEKRVTRLSVPIPSRVGQPLIDGYHLLGAIAVPPAARGHRFSAELLKSAAVEIDNVIVPILRVKQRKGAGRWKFNFVCHPGTLEDWRLGVSSVLFYSRIS